MAKQRQKAELLIVISILDQLREVLDRRWRPSVHHINGYVVDSESVRGSDHDV